MTGPESSSDRCGAAMRGITGWAAIGPALFLCACAGQPRVQFTAAEQEVANPVGYANVRVWADADGPEFDRFRPAVPRRGKPAYLALSGGGGDGAFGAGLLKGWSETGTRPRFAIVSGVSTGALIAPFAYLGSAYDDRLREFYTGGYGAELVSSPNLISLLSGEGLYGKRELRALVARFIDAPLLAEIAREDKAGRRLVVVTTNLDAQRAVIWNLGAIARAGDERALELFRDVVTASASVPALFAPVLINAEAGDREFQELHVDGGVTGPVFTLPERFLQGRSQNAPPPPLDIYVIMNSKVEPTFQVTEPGPIATVTRSVSAAQRAQSRAILTETEAYARRNGSRFSYTYLPKDHVEDSSTGFDTAYMRTLYDYGLARARSGRLWTTLAARHVERR